MLRFIFIHGILKFGVPATIIYLAVIFAWHHVITLPDVKAALLGTLILYGGVSGYIEWRKRLRRM
ncbi:hypothetical protein SAMN05443245_6647 [Paraburkholderia fungorum]|uniref:Uncharacterized protein n=1 Tax=Paraburkholderia fungorum TaxID=134537 RepID=A0A1H1JK41_9BURK|nr:hypothetical protein [Paraburkholderia fungorum]SDR50363.1 hypothetical protein SAMN05443245_6647 [Paraburkholderia fungorum]